MSTNASFSNAAAARPRLALIAGPTASGKSDLAVRLALLAAERGQQAIVINADSAQVYADLAVLSARPTQEDMRGVPHRLFGTWNGAVACSAADWANAARQEITDAHAAGVLPILVGGTGLYIRTLLEGIAPVPEIDPAIRDRVRAMPVADAYAALQAEDAERAGRLAPNDASRITRALEVVRSTGHPLSFWQERREGGIGGMVTLLPLVLLPDRAWLYERCDRRFSAMFEDGAVEEAETLLARQLDPALPVTRAIGVREIAAMLAGELSREDAVAAGQQATRNYAKRQYTWLRHQLPHEWPRAASENVISDDQIVSLFQL
ncbi:tRNA (adenosine(37)-N6)-dimethylallyltransferase MiaA [Novosphingobium sp. ZN18A2]|uniref:tRNA (adenosine(37)-N6)-dimethylallyltransferase MiaA n=1 Tax=Novosphingobium sp. ZN18A2 TaxID=3079861 RepID=UPI0030D4CF17